MDNEKRRIHAGFTAEKGLLDQVKALAEKESRPLSQMIAVLLKEALAARAGV